MGHFYDRQGRPAYQALTSKGKLVDTTLREARLHGLYKSVTTVNDQLAKYQLEDWKIDQIGIAIKEFPFDPKEDDIEAYWQSMVKVSKRISEESRDKGKEIHAAMEDYYKTGSFDEKFNDWCRPAIEMIKNEIGEYTWVAEKSFTYLTYGGCVDLHTRDGKGIIIDFKTKFKDKKKDLKGYIENVMQIAAYRYGLGLPQADCYNVFISSKVKDLVVIQKFDEQAIKKAWVMFKCLSLFYDLKNNYHPPKVRLQNV